MVSCKVILAVVVVAVAVVQGRPGADTDWAITLFNELKSLTSNMTSMVNNTAEYAAIGQKNMESFANGLRTDAEVFKNSFEGKSSVSDVFKESTKQFQTVVDTYLKNLPKDFNMKDIADKSELALKKMVEHGTEMTKKAQGNTEVEKQVKDFIKKYVDILFQNAKDINAQITETKKA